MVSDAEPGRTLGDGENDVEAIDCIDGADHRGDEQARSDQRQREQRWEEETSFATAPIRARQFGLPSEMTAACRSVEQARDRLFGGGAADRLGD